MKDCWTVGRCPLCQNVERPNRILAGRVALLYDDLGLHEGMNGTVVVVGARSIKLLRKHGLIVQRARFEGRRIADNGVRSLISVGPLNRASSRNVDGVRRESKVLDIDRCYSRGGRRRGRRGTKRAE